MSRRIAIELDLDDPVTKQVMLLLAGESKALVESNGRANRRVLVAKPRTPAKEIAANLIAMLDPGEHVTMRELGVVAPDYERVRRAADTNQLLAWIPGAGGRSPAVKRREF